MELPPELYRQYAANLTGGSVLFWKSYPFSDGSTSDKIILLLTSCIKGKCYIYVLPTSQIQHYISGKRNMVDTVCFPLGSSTWFKKDTVIDLKKINILEVANLIPHFVSGTVKKIHDLDSSDMKKITDAVRVAETISQKVQKIILGSK